MSKIRKIKPAGWFALVIVASLLVTGALVLVQKIQAETQTLESLAEENRITPPPTYTPRPTSTPRPTKSPQPTFPPTPEGWTIERDPFTGNNYMAPPAGDEAEIREAFDAVLSAMVVEDLPNVEALEIDYEASQERAAEFATEAVVETVQSSLNVDIIQLAGKLGPENPVRCEDYDRCEITRAKLDVAAYITFDANMCTQLDEQIPDSGGNKGPDGFFMMADNGHCVNRNITDSAPYEAYAATVEHRDDRWIVTELNWEPIPEPTSTSDTGG